MTVANEGVTGTTINRFVKLTGAPSTAIIATTADVDNVIGVCVAGCGITGNATIAIIGQVTIDFDGATTAGNYVIVSVTSGGKAHDGGSTFPAGSTAYGRVLSTNGAGGAFIMELMTPDLAAAAGTSSNGKNKPPGTSPNYVFNSSNAWAGGNLFQDSTDGVAQRRTTNPQSFSIYRTFTDASNYERLELGWNGTTATVKATNAGTGAARPLNICGSDSACWQVNTSGTFVASGAARNIDMQGGTLSGGQVSIDTYTNAGSSPRFTAPGGSQRWNLLRDSTNGGGLIIPYSTQADFSSTPLNDVSLGTSAAEMQRLNATLAVNLTGLASGAGTDGFRYIFVNIGSNTITFQHQNAGTATASHRFLCSTGADIALVQDQAVTVVYDNTTQRWRVTPGIGSTTSTANVTATTALTTPIIKPPSDSTTALQITKTDGTTRVMDFDTTNARVGINKTPGAFDLDVNGAANVGGALTVIGATSLGSSAQFTVNASGLPTKSNNLTLAGQGFGPILGATSQKAETGSADANVLTVTPTATIGTYRVCTAISVASATSGVISWTLSWTDSSGNAQSNIAQQIFQMGTAAPNTTFTTSAAGNYYGCSMIDTNNGAANIVVKWVGGGTSSAKMSASVERIN